MHVFFEPVLATDPIDGERLRLQLRPGGLGLPQTDYYLQPEHAALLAAYEAHVARMLQLLGEADASVAAAAAGVLAIEARLVAARRAPRASRLLLDGAQACCRLCLCLCLCLCSASASASA